MTEISDPAERGKIVNAAWRRYGAIDSLSLAAVTTGWLGARLRESANSELSDDERRLAYANDVLVGLVAATGLATAAEGMRFARAAVHPSLGPAPAEVPIPSTTRSIDIYALLPPGDRHPSPNASPTH